MRRTALLLLALLALPGRAAAQEVVQHVDPMIGTLGTGWVFPGPAAPFGMVQNSPDTLGPLVYAGYMGNDAAIRGFSLVHLSGVGVPANGDVPFMPWVGTGEPPAEPSEYASPFTHATESAEAGYYEVLLGNGTRVELTAGPHVGMQRYTFAPGVAPTVIVDPWHNNGTAADGAGSTAKEARLVQTGPSEVAGSTSNGDYRVFFVARFDRPIAELGHHWVRFAAGTADNAVTMRAGISFVDEDGARRNLDAEAPASISFDELRAQTRAAWDRELSRVQVSGGTLADRRTFYTALYHALLHPNVFEDVDGRYHGFDDQIHDSPGRVHYANFSLWDTYRSQNQLLATLYPKRYEEMLRSVLIDAQQQGGKLPRWAMHDFDPGFMTGDPAIPMIAEGVCRGIVHGSLAEELYERAVALHDLRHPNLLARGYLSLADARYAVATTLEYAIADFTLALIARRLGRHDEADRWLARSLTYRNLLDPETKWLRPRNADGSWYQGTSPLGFDPAGDQTGYHEGNAWQYQWLVPHDARGLFDRMGPALADERLDHLFALPAEAQNRLQLYGVYYRFDTWAPGNEHDLLAPYLFPYTGRPWRTQEELRSAQELYLPHMHGLPGNDDLGTLSAWYLWTAIGFGPFVPGAPLNMVTAPVFDEVRIDLGGGTFRVRSPGASPALKYVQSATLNGKPLPRAWFGADAVRPGGTLELEMGPLPSAWATAPAAVPPSVSDSPLSAFGC